ncbi:MAG TPA: TIGR03842 family LLM class F420-dependent oxidoreductase [Solirubrobacteraceae bacterium]|nr:TIGR03842 family LLM class F420-dependent oxidoreductase [Solirubrobacteraceae bacterium]
MNFGVVLQTNPPASRVIELARRAETYGFTNAWTFDSHLLWEEPFVIYSRILDCTHKLVVGSMVTNPATRDWTVTASLFATLNEMYGNRTICGIGRGDSAVRVINGKPVKLAELRECIEVIRALANGRTADYKGTPLRFPWNPHSRLPIWVAGYGPNALKLAGEVGDGFILQLADPDIAAWSIAAVRDAAAVAGRDPDTITMCVAAPAYVTDGSESHRAHALDQCRWFGGMVGNHVADIVNRYGGDGRAVPTGLTDYIEGRRGYDYNEHGKAGNKDTEFVPDEIVERFCLIGSAESQIARLRELAALGVDHYGLYLQHDAQDATLSAYGELVIPAVAEHLLARG